MTFPCVGRRGTPSIARRPVYISVALCSVAPPPHRTLGLSISGRSLLPGQGTGEGGVLKKKTQYGAVVHMHLRQLRRCIIRIGLQCRAKPRRILYPPPLPARKKPLSEQQQLLCCHFCHVLPGPL